ncbi:MAG TPA: alpha/beta hydrolase [Polyangia bacterium]
MNDQRFVRVGKLDVGYELGGVGEPVLFIHGLGSSRADWQAQPLPPTRYRALRYDLRGHGVTSRPGDGYDPPTFAADAAALLGALELGAAHVVGLSLGGMVGLQLAVDRPELVRSLTVVNSGPEVVPRTPREKRQLALRRLLTWTLGPRHLGKLIARRLYVKPEHAPLARAFEAQMASNDRHAYLATTRAVLRWSVAHRLSEVRCPVLVVSGDRDYTPVSRKEEYMQQLRDARLVVIADSGHATPLDQPQAFNRELVRFLDAHRGAPVVARALG